MPFLHLPFVSRTLVREFIEYSRTKVRDTKGHTLIFNF
jgi:hypothetical protein